MRVYLGCERDHMPPRDATSASVRRAIAGGCCPVCPEEALAVAGPDSWQTCPCCGSGWRLEAEEGFACRPGRLVEEWE
jgi:hypothetical protein